MVCAGWLRWKMIGGRWRGAGRDHADIPGAALESGPARLRSAPRSLAAAFHGANAIEEGKLSMGCCVLDLKKPAKVLYVSDAPALTPEAPYEIQLEAIPQVDMANFKTGVRVVF